MKKLLVTATASMLICSPAFSADWALVDDNEETTMYMDNDTFHSFDLTNNDKFVSAWVKIVYKQPFMTNAYVEGKDPFMTYSNRFLVQTRCMEGVYKVASIRFYDKNEKMMMDSDSYPEIKAGMTKNNIPMEDFVYISPDLMFSKTAIYLCKND